MMPQPKPSEGWREVLQCLDTAEELMVAVHKAIEAAQDKASAAAALVDKWSLVADCIAEANKLAHELVEQGELNDLINIAKSTQAEVLATAYRLRSERIVGLVVMDAQRD